jgi:hypothetical protein
MKKFIASLMFVLSCAGAAHAESPDVPKSVREAASAWSESGLQKVSVKGLDAFYARPGVSFAEYRKVLLKPVSVAFRRGWLMTPLPGSRDRISSADARRIKDKLAALVQEEVAAELASSGYKLTDSPGDDVLEVGMSIVDLFIAAPNVRNSVATNTYAVSAGEMSLVAELRDSVSGDVLARVFDHSSAQESTWPHQITSVENTAEARIAARAWAGALRAELDLAKTPH